MRYSFSDMVLSLMKFSSLHPRVEPEGTQLGM